MAKCSYCDEDADIPFKCKFCDEIFCSSHRLPENHECLGLDKYKESAQEDRKVVYEPFQMKSSNEDGPSLSSATSFMENASKNWYIKIIFICTAIFVLQAIFPDYRHLFLLPLDVGQILQMPWTLFTAIFFHLGFWHLFVNMFVLFFFGRQLEMRIGSKKFIEIFVVAGIFGSVGFMLALSVFGAPAAELGGRGASGAIFGVLGTLAVIAPELKVLMLLFPVPIKIRHFVVLYAILDLFLLGAGMLGSGGHLFGLVAGVIYGYRLKNKEIGTAFNRLVRNL